MIQKVGHMVVRSQAAFMLSPEALDRYLGYNLGPLHELLCLIPKHLRNTLGIEGVSKGKKGPTN
jgi:hypothetical protein